jgi:hypothetical protein
MIYKVLTKIQKMKLKYLLAIIFILTGLSGYSQNSVFKAGAAVRLITPDPLIAVSGGVGTPKPVKEKQGDLYVHALVFEKGGKRVAIVNIDNLGWPAVLGDKSRKLIKGIPPENILIGVSHTHSAPDAYAFPDMNGEIGADLDYLEWCTVQIADAVNEAIKKLEPADLKISVDEAKGKIAYNYYAPKLYDPRCGVIQAIATSGVNKGKPIVTLVNYATHPEIIGSDRGILSPDLCGPLCDRITEKTGGLALFMNSAQGGMVTADNRLGNGKEASDWTECKRNGELLADEALRIITGAEIQKNPDLFCTSKVIEFPVESEMMRMILNNSPLNMGTTKDNTITTRVNLLNIGTAQILTIPGEALPNIGFYLKRKMPTKHPFLFGLTNDAFGYILTKVDFDSFKSYKYISKTCLGENTGEIYIEEALKLIENSPIPTK